VKKLSSLFFWLFFLLYLEIVLKIALFGFDNVFNINLLYMFTFLIPAATLLHLITILFNNKTVNKIIAFFVVIFTTVIFVAQLVYYKTFLSIFSVYSMAKAEQIFDFTDTIIR
jgi:hypothetical protein